jgi:CBS domain-containing protein
VLQFSIPVGRWLGVHVRVHASLLLLLALAAGYSLVAAGGAVRGIALWLALCAAVLVREAARAIAAAYFGMPLRALFLLPVGGVMALAPRRGGLPANETRVITWVGSAANFGLALLLLGFAYGVDPHVHLFLQPWISVEHILRSAVWLQVIVGAVNLIPSAALPTRRVVRSKPEESAATTQAAGLSSRWKGRPAFGLGTAFALAMMVAGVISGLVWPVLLGITILLTSYLNKAAGIASVESLPVAVRDVMLTEYRPLSASSTLRDALQQTTHTMQELFPVLRGERLVGWISRGALVAKLRAEGDGFLQGAMSRSLQAAEPGEKIGDALRRASALGASEFVPVVEDGAMVGVLTPSSLERAVGQLRWTQALAQRDER